LEKLTIKRAKKEIEEFVKHPGEYGPNIVLAFLRIIAKEYGYGEANKLVTEFNLKNNFDIEKYWPVIDMLKNKIGVNEWVGPTEAKYHYHPMSEHGTRSI